MLNHSFDVLLSTVSSSLRFWNGTSASRSVKQPEQDIVLFDREGCSECRLVREALTELNLDVMIAPCPLGGRNIKSLKAESGSDTVPTLVDANTGEKHVGAAQIIPYLFKQYKQCEAPAKFAWKPLNRLSSALATRLRGNAGMKARPARPVSQPLTLYSFESSPFSRPVRELLCELELPYKLVNLGKQQWADMGPAKARFTVGPYKPLPNTKRDAFFKEHGNVQVPYLIDPNTNVQMFESQDIVVYLKKNYAL